jgi:hypothetical protein
MKEPGERDKMTPKNRAVKIVDRAGDRFRDGMAARSGYRIVGDTGWPAFGPLLKHTRDTGA